MSNNPNIWPPPPSDQPVDTEGKPAKNNTDGRDVFAVLFISFIALCIGLGAGGHKDFSESLLANIEVALLDLSLWSVCIIYWFVLLKKKWAALGTEPARPKKSMLKVYAHRGRVRFDWHLRRRCFSFALASHYSRGILRHHLLREPDTGSAGLLKGRKSASRDGEPADTGI